MARRASRTAAARRPSGGRGARGSARVLRRLAFASAVCIDCAVDSKRLTSSLYLDVAAFVSRHVTARRLPQLYYPMCCPLLRYRHGDPSQNDYAVSSSHWHCPH